MNLLPVGLDFAPGKGEINRASWSLNATREADCPQESLEAIMYLSDRITFLTCGVAVVAGLGPQRHRKDLKYGVLDVFGLSGERAYT